nr:MAG TPA: hypothetical protein [Caudoviricetes sp.]
MESYWQIRRTLYGKCKLFVNFLKKVLTKY